jgi:polar amino acid transport system substrate-binding protein
MKPIARLLLALLFTSGAFVTSIRAADPAPLRVGITPAFPPMIYKEKGNLVGVEADFAKALGEELGRPVKFVELDWDEQITALTEGRTDIIMSAMSITRPRQFRVAFARPYLTIGQMALVRRSDLNKYALGFPTWPKGVLGVKKATTGDFLVQQEFPQAKRKYFDSAEKAAKALGKKQIDLFISDSPTIWWLEGVNAEAGLAAVPIVLSEEQLAWAVRKSDAELLESANRLLDKLQANGQGAATLIRWVPHLK